MAAGAGSTTEAGFSGSITTRTSPSGAGSPITSPTSPAPPWSCAAPRATYSTRRMPSVWLRIFPTAGKSRSRRPDTLSRATTQRTWWPHCASFSDNTPPLPDQPADPVVFGVADIDRPVGSDHGAVRAGKTGRQRRAALAFAALPAAGDGFDSSVRGIDAADRMVLGIDDQDIAAGVESELLRRVENRVPRRAAVAAVTARTGAGPGGDDPGTR